MTFSGALTLTDLNDFITPSQACIKPVEEINPLETEREPGAAATDIQIDSTGGYYQVSRDGPRARTKLQAAEISLNDCLACSGCITSAESVLITMQSHLQVLDFLSRNPAPLSPEHAIPVLSISPQSLASISASISPPYRPSVPLTCILARVRAFCQQKLKIEHVFDTTFARHIALREHVAEFRERMQTENYNHQLPMLASACPGWVCYVEKAHAEMISFMSKTKSPQQIMGSIIKHWIGAKCGKTPDKMYHITVMPCYDKKLEASRSDFYNEQYSTRDVDCVLTTGELELMMRDEGWDIRSPVPNEASACNKFDIPDLLQHSGSSSGSYLQHLIASVSHSVVPTPMLTTRRIRSDYEEYTLTNPLTREIVFKGARCYGFRNLQNIVRKVGKEHGIGSRRGAAAAGRMAGGRSNTGVSGPSLRAVARRRRAGPATAPEAEANDDAAASKGYDYVEVMACPGGCVNGGGQLKPPPSSSRASSSQAVDEEGYPRNWEASGATPSGPALGQEPDMSASGRWGDKEWIKRVENAYWNTHGILTPPPSPPASVASLQSLSPTPINVEKAHAFSAADALADGVIADILDVAESRGTPKAGLLRTEYRAVVSEVVGLAVKW